MKKKKKKEEKKKKGNEEKVLGLDALVFVVVEIILLSFEVFCVSRVCGSSFCEVLRRVNFWTEKRETSSLLLRQKKPPKVCSRRTFLLCSRTEEDIRDAVVVPIVVV